MAVEVGETGIEDLLPAFADKKIDHRPLIIPAMEPSVAQHARLLTEFEELLDKAVDPKNGYRTLLIDSASRLWRHVRIVMTEKAQEERDRKKKNQADFELANDYFEQIIQMARRNKDLNIVLLHRHREIFRTEQGGDGRDRLVNTGEVEARDYKGLENMVQILVKCGVSVYNYPKTGPQQVLLHTIQLCRFKRELQGMQVRDMDYAKLMERVFGRAVEPAGA